MQNPAQPSPASQVPPPFCGVPGAELAAMAQAGWNQMEGGGAAQPAPASHQSCLPPGGQPGGALTEQPSISLSAQAELELELSLRGSLLVQQQRRIVQLEDELQRAWAEIDRLRTKIAAVERERQRTEDDSQKQARESAPGGRARRAPPRPCPPSPRAHVPVPRPLCAQPRYWTPDEHRLFMEAVQRFGWKDVKSIAQHVGTRTPTQVRTHAQKLFLRQQKEQTGAHPPPPQRGPPVARSGRRRRDLGLFWRAQA